MGSVFVEIPEWYLVKWPEGRPGLVFGILPRCDCVDRVAIVGKFASFRVFGEVLVVKLMVWSTTLNEIQREFTRLVLRQDDQNKLCKFTKFFYIF